MMDILNQLRKKNPDFPKAGSVVVQTDSESLMVKNFFFQSGRSVVSDRDVYTLEYELTRHLSQTKGLRVLDDQLYPFLFSAKAERDAQIGALNFIKNFPDPFVSPELAEVLIEFLEQEESAQKLLKTFKDSVALFGEKKSFNAVPRGFANLYLNELKFNETTYFLSSLLDSLPLELSDLYCEKRIELSTHHKVWKDQIELFEYCKNDESLEFYNFEHQLEEVRCVLSEVSKEQNKQKTLILFPQNQGYEKLFYIYQREFFEEQQFSLYEKELETIKKVIRKMALRVKTYQTQYDLVQPTNKNRIIRIDTTSDKFSLEEVVETFFEKDFTELDLNIVSSLRVQLGEQCRLELQDWKRIFELELIKLSKKHEKIQSQVAIKSFEYVPEEKPDKIWVLGWSDGLFKKMGDRLFSNSIMSKMEINLGLQLPSLSQSEANTLFKNPLMGDSTVLKKLCFSNQSFQGGSNKPGVFKILLEGHRSSKSKKAQRGFFNRELELVTDRARLKKRELSASSLQRYEECPYKFYLEKVIGLTSEEEEDYFLSPREEGSLMHELLEDLSEAELSKERFDEKLASLIKAKDPDFDLFRENLTEDISERIWKILSEEKSHLLESSVVETLSEKFFKFEVDLKSKKITDTGGDFSIRGLVDRIDVSQNNKALIYDYKRGDSGTHSLSLYKGTKLAPQLFIYCLAADHGFLGDFERFVGFQYINLTLNKRQKGFVIKQQAEGVAKEIPARSAVEEDKYEEKMSIFLEKFWSILERIQNQDFDESPNPVYSGQCASCTWQGVCKKSETFT